MLGVRVQACGTQVNVNKRLSSEFCLMRYGDAYLAHKRRITAESEQCELSLNDSDTSLKAGAFNMTIDSRPMKQQKRSAVTDSTAESHTPSSTEGYVIRWLIRLPAADALAMMISAPRNAAEGAKNVGIPEKFVVPIGFRSNTDNRPLTKDYRAGAEVVTPEQLKQIRERVVSADTSVEAVQCEEEVHILLDEVERLNQKIRELENNLRVCRDRITEHRIRADRAECYMRNADQNVHRYKEVQKHIATRGTKQCLGGLYDVFEIKLPSSEGFCLDEKLDALISKGVDN